MFDINNIYINCKYCNLIIVFAFQVFLVFFENKRCLNAVKDLSNESTVF